MTPDMMIRITAKNDTAVGFGSVVKDAKAASTAVVASGAEAEAALAGEAAAMKVTAEAASLSSMQIAELGHITRSVVGTISSGGGVMRAFSNEGNRIVSVFSIGQGGVGGTFRALGGLLADFLPVLLPIAAVVGTVALAFAGLTTKINETSKVHVSFGNVFMATMQVAAGAIGKFFQPAISQLGKWFGQFVDWVTPLFKGVVNGIIDGFQFAFDAVKDVWGLLPDAFASIFTKAMNGAIDIVQNGINAIIAPINSLLTKVGISAVPLADLSAFKGTASNADQKVGSIISADATRDFANDPAGAAFAAMSGRSQQLALADAAKGTGKAAAATKNALADGLKSVGGVLDSIQPKADKFANAFQAAGQGIAGLLRGSKDLGSVLASIAGSLVSSADFSMFGGQSAGIGSLLKGLLGGLVGGGGFANGGAGVVGGTGGTDSKLFLARATPGEPYAFGKQAVDGINGGGPTLSRVHVTVGIDDEGKLQAYVARQGRAVYAASVQTARKSMPVWQRNVQLTGAP